MADRARVHLLITGRVQGVAFRAYTVDEGRQAGVSGWARNLPDGSVEVEAEGERGAVEALVAFCRRGPPAARVDAVKETWAPFRGDLSGFGVRR
jgi:acylphosphatase